jgi:hypothetical protein
MITMEKNNTEDNSKINELISLMNKKEKLNEELIAFLDNRGYFPMLRHPLVFSVPYSEAFNAMLNVQLAEKTKKAKQYYQEKKFSSYIFIHERPYRLNALLDCVMFLEGKEYWELLSDVWVDSENIWQNIKIWKKLLKQNKETKHFFMSDDDKAEFDKLPEAFTVYRGYIEGKNKSGLSYTTDKKRAMWFANRFGKNGKVAELTVSKKDVLAYTNRRDEKEIIFLK